MASQSSPRISPDSFQATGLAVLAGEIRSPLIMRLILKKEPDLPLNPAPLPSQSLTGGGKGATGVMTSP
jgi:hypothetical protein